MRKAIFFTLLIHLSVILSAQFEYEIDFDSNDLANKLIYIDTVSNPNNQWKIGIPNKAVFDSAYSPYKSIVTDSLMSYRDSDTSSFILTFNRPKHNAGTQVIILDFWFRIDSDTLKDYGKIEVSSERSSIWIDLLKEDTTYNLFWGHPKPVLSGSTQGWTRFSIDVSSLLHTFEDPDTFYYRFTFISDSIPSNRDGWIIDDIYLYEIWESVFQNSSNLELDIFPNPTTGYLKINTDIPDIDKAIVSLYNLKGEEVFKNQLDDSKTLNFDFPTGMYIIKMLYNNTIYSNKLLIIDR